jgi:hypothetical protein
MLCHSYSDTKYKWIDAKAVINQQTHLNTQQNADLLDVLHEDAKMFAGTLDLY